MSKRKNKVNLICRDDFIIGTDVLKTYLGLSVAVPKGYPKEQLRNIRETFFHAVYSGPSSQICMYVSEAIDEQIHARS